MIERRVNVRGIVFKNGELLCQKLTANSIGIVPNWWCTPGGGLESGESLIDGLRREMIEETGVEPEIGKLLFMQQYFDGTKEHLEFFFHIKNVDDYESIDLTATSHGIAEVEHCEFIDQNQDIRPIFLKTIDIQEYIENTLPVMIDNHLPASLSDT